MARRRLDKRPLDGYLSIMNLSFADIVQEALRLPQKQQLRLARTILESGEASGDLGAETAWEDEIERRIRLVDSGLAKGRPFSEVLRDIDQRLGKRR